MSQTKVQLINNVIGNSGFGTASAGVPLQIAASVPAIRLADTDGATPFSNITAGGGDLVFEADQGNEEANTLMLFRVDDSEKMRIDSEGRVAISSTATYFDTNTMLEVVGKTGAGPNLVLHRNDTTVSTNQVLAALRVTGNDNDGSTQQETASIVFAADGDHANNDKPGRIVFGTTADGGSSSTERMRIDSSGNVGIGTSTIGNKLQVHEASSNASFAGFSNDTTGSSSSDGLIVGVDSDENGVLYHYENKAIRFGTNNSERMRILNDGAVCINATARPVVGTEFLGVHGGSASNAVGIGAAVSHKSGIPFFASNGSNTTSQRLMRFAAGSGGDTRGTITFNGSSLVYGTSSDYRLKKNVQQISNGITKLKALKPISFDWIKETDNNNVMGFLAHEVQEVIPQVITGEKDEVQTTYYIEGDTIPDGKKVGDVKDTNVPVYQEMDYGGLTPLLVAALQEEISKREALEARVTTLEAA